MYTHRFSVNSSQNRVFSNLKPLQHLVGGSVKSVVYFSCGTIAGNSTESELMKLTHLC